MKRHLGEGPPRLRESWGRHRKRKGQQWGIQIGMKSERKMGHGESLGFDSELVGNRL